MQLKKQQLQGDIVIYGPGPGEYVITKMGGHEIGTSHDVFKGAWRLGPITE